MTPPAPVRAVVLGPTYCDLVFGGLERLPELGEERFARSFLVAPGGSAITAIALHRLGHAVHLCADVGRDALAGWLRDALTREGVGIDALRAVQEITPVTAALSTAADRAFVTYLEPPGPAPDLAAVLRATGGHPPARRGLPRGAGRPRTGRRRPRAGRDGVVRPRLGRPRARRPAGAPGGAGRRRAAAQPPGGGPAPRRGRRRRRAAERRGGARAAGRPAPRARHRRQGRRGGAWGKDARASVHVAAPAVDAIDATGAGDVFDAGFLDAWWAGAPLEDCLRRGAWCGARATTAIGGATAAPTRAQLDAPRREEPGGTT